MPRYVAFLRAVNVGGRIVKMDELRGHFEDAGFSDVDTFIASGNVIFSTAAKPAATIESTIEKHLEKSLGYEVPTFVRTLAEVTSACERLPFTDKAVTAAGACIVGLLKPPVDTAAEARLNALEPAVSTFKVLGHELYWLSKVRQGESKLTPGKIEKALGGSTTMRSITSIRKLAAKHCSA